ncbi:MAG: hypothetical protein WDN03_03435 [Rhizomicrobium sp.]
MVERVKVPNKSKGRTRAPYIDGDTERFEARLHARAGEPRVPPPTATKGKRTRFTGMTTQGTVAAVKAEHSKKR